MLKNKKYRFIIFALLLIILKQLLVCNFPIMALGDSGCDDQLMLKLEYSLLKLNWLGDYNSLTLVKGMFFSLFLAINAFLGISYINAINILYSVSCLVFIYSISDWIKNEKIKYIAFLILLFNPIMYCTDVVGRVYRNSLTPSQVLLIISSMFIIFKNRKEKKANYLWSTICGLVLASFYNTREDAIWIMPFIITFIFIMIVEHVIINKKNIEFKKIGCFVLPLVILIGINNMISIINYKEYGIYTRVDVENTSFSNAMKSIYSVPDDKIEYVSVSRNKLNKLYEVSPSLYSIKDSLEYYMDIYSKIDRNPNDNEVEDGWFWWVLRFAVEREGYYENAATASDFYEKITDEIELAQQENKLKKIKTMPSALMSPWKKGYIGKLVKTLYKSYLYTNKFTDISASPKNSLGSDKNIGLFEATTNDKAIYPYSTEITGVLKTDKNIDLNIIYNDNILYNLECKKNEECIVDYFSDNEINYDELVLKINDDSYSFKEKLIVDEDNYNYKKMEFNIGDGNYFLRIKSNYEVVSNQLKISNVYALKLNIITHIYKFLGLPIAIVSLISYIFISILVIFKDRKLIEQWLVISSVLGTYLVLLAGVSYNHISSCYSITTLYLSGSYPLIIVLDILNINTLYNYLKNKKM